MADLAAKTKDSPRIENGVLYFYEGDTFVFKLDLNFTQDGEPLEIEPTDTVIFEFKDERGDIIASQIFTNIVDNKVDMEWDTEFTSHFSKGKYTYRARYISDFTTTIIADNVVIVC